MTNLKLKVSISHNNLKGEMKMKETIEFIQNYKNESIIIKKRGKERVFCYGTKEFPTMKDAKNEIDKIKKIP